MTWIERLSEGFQTTDDVDVDVTRFLTRHDCAETADHVAAVAAEAAKLARRFFIDEEQATLAGWLHDISAVIPNGQRIQAARELNIDVLPEEEQFPMIIHQKLSVPIAHELFGVPDPTVLSAIECHTTLKANPSTLDMIVFVADKVAWDRPGTPPYLNELVHALDKSLDAAALSYVDYLWRRRGELRVIHPWLVDARVWLVARLAEA